MKAQIVYYVCVSFILCNVGCENGEDQKLGKDDDIKNALVAVGKEDDGEDTSVEQGIQCDRQ